ncbi:MAG: prepilin-type N-terminal cleavage/methylation domain-containing protein [Hyphomicrobiales bacterium]|nr:prepilin-type N-terminal cleavage/methylation domain-containing protein [Hyphomicrobiales bacterium]
MSHPKNPDRRGGQRSARLGEQGFTLIEGLVALAVVAAALGALAELNGQSRRATLAVEHRSALAAAAGMIEIGLPGRDQLRDGERSGVVDGHRWRLQTTALPASPGTPWRPHRLSLQVQGPGGETLQIETIRLQPQAAQ